MTRAEHALEAEQLLARAHAQFQASQRSATQSRVHRDEAHWYLKAAGVHAQLALIDIEPAAAPATKDERPKPRPPVVIQEWKKP